MSTLDELVARKKELKAKVKQLQESGAADDVITPVFEEYQAVSAQVKAGGAPASPAPAAAAPAAPAQDASGGGGGRDRAALEARKKELKAQVKALQSAGAPDDEITPVFEEYQAVSEQLKNMPADGGADSSAAPAAANSNATSASTGDTGTPMSLKDLGALEEEKSMLKGKIAQAQANNEDAAVIQPLYDRYLEVKNLIKTASVVAAPADGGDGSVSAQDRIMALTQEKGALKAKIKAAMAQDRESDYIQPLHERYAAIRECLDAVKTKSPEEALAMWDAHAIHSKAADTQESAPPADDTPADTPAEPAATTPEDNNTPAATETGDDVAVAATDSEPPAGSQPPPSEEDKGKGDALDEPADLPSGGEASDYDDDVGVVMGADEFSMSYSSDDDLDLVRRKGLVGVRENVKLRGLRFRSRFASMTSTEFRIWKSQNDFDNNGGSREELALDGAAVRFKPDISDTAFEVLGNRNLTQSIVVQCDNRDEAQAWVGDIRRACNDVYSKAKKSLRFAAAPPGFNGNVLHMNWIRVTRVNTTNPSPTWKYLVLCDFCANLYDSMPMRSEHLDESEGTKMDLIGAQIHSSLGDPNIKTRKNTFYLNSGRGPLYEVECTSGVDYKRWTAWLTGASRRALYIRTKQPIVYYGTTTEDGVEIKATFVLTRSTLSMNRAVKKDSKLVAGSGQESYELMWKHALRELRDFRAVIENHVVLGLELNFGEHREGSITFLSSDAGAAINLIHALITETVNRRKAKMAQLEKQKGEA